MGHGAATTDGKTDLEDGTPPHGTMAERGQRTYVRDINFRSATRNAPDKAYSDFGLPVLSF